MLHKGIKWLILCCMLMLPCACACSEGLEVLFFNAGKADACLLTTQNSTVLIDTGKNKFGSKIVSYLEERGIDEIDLMIITHFDKDHVGGADKVLEAVRVHQILEPDYFSDSKQYRQYREAAAAAQTPVMTLSQNIAFELDGVSYLVDTANRRDYGKDQDNDFSLVVSARYGENSFLFAGDAENPRLSELLAEGIGKHDVLKVPHHGKAEKRSEQFFAAVCPAYSVITSDEDDLEDESVVHALRRYGNVFLTRMGNVRCVCTGNGLTFTQEN